MEKKTVCEHTGLTKSGWGIGKIFKAGIGVIVSIILLSGIVMMIPRSLTSLCPWDEMDEQRMWVRWGRWEWSASANSNYKIDTGEFSVGTEGYERMSELLQTTKCSGFVQSLFSREGYTVSGAQENISVDIAYKKDGEYGWNTYHVYNNGTVIIESDNGKRRYYMDWFGREDCDRFFEEVKTILKECESEENNAK